MMNIRGIIWGMVIITGIASCGDPVADDEAEKAQIKQDSLNQANLDADAFDQYIADNGFGNSQVTVTESGLRHLVLDEGPGEQYMKVNDIVSFDYVSKFVDGKIFDTSIRQVAIDEDILSNNARYDPLVYNYITQEENLQPRFGAGFGEGLEKLMPLLSVGGRGIVMVPSAIIVRTAGFIVPDNTPVIFELSLVQLRP